MIEQLSERGKDLVKYMPQAVNALADKLDRLIDERFLYGEKPQTNADRIREMTDEDLAEFFGMLPCCPQGIDLEELCYPLESCEGTDLQVKCWLKWLKKEADNG